MSKRYQFIAGCPACGSRDRGLWRHKDCSSYEEIDEDGWIYCLGCKKYLGFLMDLQYNCGNHDYQSATNSLHIFQALTVMADIQKDIPPDFSANIVLKVNERCQQIAKNKKK